MAGVSALATERDKLERICRYIARPLLAEDRLSLNIRGELVYPTAIKLTQMQFLERLVALVPRPRVYLTRYHGVLGPHYKHRKLIVPQTLVVPKPPAKPEQPELGISSNTASKPKNTKRIPWARLLKRVFNIDIEICPRCTGKLEIIAAIEDPKVIKKILTHIGLPADPPQPHPARGPPQSEFGDLVPMEIYDN